ncbi:MAG: PAS domain S-box protein [Gammaproteobacteria bacterium]
MHPTSKSSFLHRPRRIDAFSPAVSRVHDDHHLNEALERLRQRILELERMEMESRAKEERLLGVVQELDVHREELYTQNENLLHAQAELEESQRSYIDLFEYAPVGYLFLDREGVIHQLNLQGAQMLGYSRAHVLGKPLWLYLPRTYRDALAQHLRMVFRRNRAAVEVGIRRGDGSTFYGALESMLVPETAGFSRYCRTALLDVTERRTAENALRESEERFRNLIEGSIQGIYIHQDWRPLFVNQAYADILGYDSPEEILAMTCFEHHIAPHERPRLRDYLTRRLVGESVPVHYEYDALRKDGALVTLDKVVRLIQWKGEVAVQDTVIDITARRRAEEQARKREAELAHVARLSTMGEMATTLAHELNQPLTAIVSYTEGALRRFGHIRASNPELIEVLDQIGQLTKRAAQIVKGMRNFVRKKDAQFEPLDFNQAVSEAARLINAEVHKKEIRMELYLAPDLPLVNGSLVQLEQVVLNLIRNAIEAIEEADSEPRNLTLRTFTNRRAELELTVRDSGVGLDPAIAPRVLEAFVTTKHDGLGLGLSISRTILESHGGRLWATPNERRGTTFHLTLPTPPNTDVC